MVFNSYTFLVFFLPLTLLGFLLLSRRGLLRTAFCWLVIASLFYYGWWKPIYLVLIGGSCVGNYFVGKILSDLHKDSRGKLMLTFGVVSNLGLLGWYKYSGFLDRTVEALAGFDLHLPHVVLPLGISFFTFQQVAYLVDAHRGEAGEYNFIDYLLFVTFFPQLIAGPIVHHKEMMPQFERQTWRHHRWVNFSVGGTILLIGLFKKVVIADNVSRIATGIFNAAAADERLLTIGEAWTGALAYTVQIYFDFSGYSDMAIGAARLFGIRLPLNFHSPYKAVSITEFWRRWHITLSRFLRDYLYIPLGGNRLGKPRRYTNLMVTMLLGGLWHGAGWTFVVWGALHGLYLCINHAWVFLRRKWNLRPLPKPLAVALTFFSVVIAWVFFRAGIYELGPKGSPHDAITAAKNVLAGMFGMNGLEFWPDRSEYVVKSSHALRAAACIILFWLLPNTQQFMRRYQPAIDASDFEDFTRGPRRWWQWRPTPAWFAFTIILLLVTIHQFDKLSEFIYFQF